MRNQIDREGIHLEALIEQIDLPFTDEIMEEEVPPKFKVVSVKPYDGKKDPTIVHSNLGWNYMGYVMP